MCGIGAVSFRSASPTAMRAALEAINHRQRARGPDGSGLDLGASGGVGMVRLRVRADRAEPEPVPISELSTAAYNGEVYWHDGAVPDGGSGEVLALGRDRGGDIDGMYAIATLDRPSGRIEIRRDRFGIKPLYRRDLAGGVAVASTVGGLIEAFGSPAIRTEAVAQFLAFGRPLDGGSFFEDIAAVPRGSRWVMQDGRLELDGEDRPAGRTQPAAPSPEALRDAVSEAIRRVLPSNRTLGLAVSGGLDSTILAHQLASMGIEELRTVSIRVDGDDDGLADLGPLGLTAPAAVTWRHRVGTVTPERFARGAERAVADLGEPTRLTSVPLYAALADCAAEAGIVVLLVGEGADELFMGYSSYLNVAAGNPRATLDFLLPESRHPYLEALLGAGSVARLHSVARGRYPAVPGETPLDHLRRIELDHSLEPLLLRADQLLMARSIEGRTPFLHGRVPDLAFAVPAEDHLRNGTGKALLRAAFPEIQARQGPWQTKRPFRAPVGDWLRGPLRPWLDETLGSGTARLRELGLRDEGLALVRADLDRGHAAAYDMAYALMSLAFWCRWLDDGGCDDRA